MTGDQVSVHYDPMIAKLIVSGQNRQQAVKKIADALKDFKVVGVRTNIEFIQKILSRKEYLDEKAVDTGFIQTHSADLFGRTPVHHDQLIMASLFLLYKSSHYQDENCTCFNSNHG